MAAVGAEAESDGANSPDTVIISQATQGGPSSYLVATTPIDELTACMDDIGLGSAFMGGSAHAGRAEKAADNPDNPFGSRLDREHTSTPTAVTQLFEAPSSPLSSRAASDVRVTSLQPKGSEKLSLAGHIYNRGLLEGRHSDVMVNVFGKSYALHRLILERSPFFEAAFNGLWKEASAGEISLYPEDTDPNISRTTFELALKRLYGCHNTKEEESEAIGLLATASWLDLQDLVEDCVSYTLDKLGLSTIGVLIEYLSKHDYGTAGQKIMGAAKAALCRVGVDLPFALWDEIPSSVIRELVGSDCFFVHDEWQRFLLARALLNHRLSKLATEVGLVDPGTNKMPKVPRNFRDKAVRLQQELGADAKSAFEPSKILTFYSHPNIRPLLDLIDNDIYYVHLEFEQLQRIRSSKDVFGIPVLPEHIIKDALWMGMEFRENIVNSDGSNRLFSCNDRYGCSEKSQYSIPQTDRNVIVGGNADPSVTNAIFTSKSPLSTHVKQGAAGPSRASLTHKTGPEQSAATRKHHSHYPPFRFAAEFPNPHLRREGKRTYSRTVFYAGSYWNLYIQKVRKSGRQPQLGVYVHRTKDNDENQVGNRAKTSVDQRISFLERELALTRPQSSLGESSRRQGSSSTVLDEDRTLVSPGELRNARLAAYLASSNARTSSSPSIPSAARAMDDEGTGSSDLDDEADTLRGRPGSLRRASVSSAHAPVIPPYVDGRQTVVTYFKIFSPSRSGRMMSVYESAPDHFDFSQSWGWKSSTLMVNDLNTPTSEGMEPLTSLEISTDSIRQDMHSDGIDPDPEDALEQQAEKIEGGLADGRLRFMVVLGVV